MVQIFLSLQLPPPGPGARDSSCHPAPVSERCSWRSLSLRAVCVWTLPPAFRALWNLLLLGSLSFVFLCFLLLVSCVNWRSWNSLKVFSNLSPSFAENEVYVCFFHFPCFFWTLPGQKGKNAEPMQPKFLPVISSPPPALMALQMSECAPQSLSPRLAPRFLSLLWGRHPGSEPCRIAISPRRKFDRHCIIDASSHLGLV